METNNDLLFTDFQKPKRSQLLTALCVLSFIMCAITLISSAINIINDTPAKHQQTIQQLKTVDPVMADQMEDMYIAMDSNIYLKISPYINMVCMLISFLGILMMWNLNRKGFYIYAIAEILPYTMYLFTGLKSMPLPGIPEHLVATVMMTVIVLMVLCDLVFVFLYSKTLKEMS